MGGPWSLPIPEAEPLLIETAENELVLKDASGALILRLRVDPDRGFLLAPAEGVVLERMDAAPANPIGAALWSEERGLLVREHDQWVATPGGATVGLVLAMAYMRRHVDPAPPPTPLEEITP